MTGLWQHLVAAGLLRDALGVAVAHVLVLPHFVTWLIVRRRKKQKEDAR